MPVVQCAFDHFWHKVHRVVPLAQVIYQIDAEYFVDKGHVPQSISCLNKVVEIFSHTVWIVPMRSMIVQNSGMTIFNWLQVVSEVKIILYVSNNTRKTYITSFSHYKIKAVNSH